MPTSSVVFGHVWVIEKLRVLLPGIFVFHCGMHMAAINKRPPSRVIVELAVQGSVGPV